MIYSDGMASLDRLLEEKYVASNTARAPGDTRMKGFLVLAGGSQVHLLPVTHSIALNSREKIFGYARHSKGGKTSYSEFVQPFGQNLPERWTCPKCK